MDPKLLIKMLQVTLTGGPAEGEKRGRHTEKFDFIRTKAGRCIKVVFTRTSEEDEWFDPEWIDPTSCRTSLNQLNEHYDTEIVNMQTGGAGDRTTDLLRSDTFPLRRGFVHDPGFKVLSASSERAEPLHHLSFLYVVRGAWRKIKTEEEGELIASRKPPPPPPPPPLRSLSPAAADGLITSQ
ncbi:unnamed protein product [Pleuronectes platessa]|uniref:Uncharacterized protein n=1 Tax=Pleuronectes platessa TaxID=8262 RepID=A0A9N7Y8V2_PLEPL|nr:unnamed protein product [Pleuronectes platessa]